jgi:hypothetical protein
MDNQHRQIKGYRDLSQDEIDLMNQIKNVDNELHKLIDQINKVPDIDQRWVEIARTDLQKGFMGLTRAVAKPDSF